MKKIFFKIVYVFSVLFFIGIAIFSCRKDRPDTDTQSSVDNSICEAEFSRIMPQTNHIAVGDSGVQRYGLDIPIPNNNCPDYYIDSADIADGFPITMSMYYGQDNDGDGIYEVACTGSDGKARAGMVTAVFSGPWHRPGTTVTHTLQNYYVNGIKYEGTITVTKNVNSFTQTVSNGKCTEGTEWTILWNSSRTLTYSDGGTILYPFDDVCLISGSASGTDRNNKAFSVDIDANNPLKFSAGCPYIVKGAQTIKIQDKKDRTVDYGDGTCDNKATLTIDGNVFEFTLQ